AAGSIDSLSRSSAGVTVTSIRRAATAGYATCDHGVGRGVLPALGSDRRVTLAAGQPEQPNLAGATSKVTWFERYGRRRSRSLSVAVPSAALR
ncbi:MAG: hypothetical protein ACRDSZ_05410, partial [Pseudonocardiaceae bacterium]